MSQALQDTDEHGGRTAIVAPIQNYEKFLEDLDDLAVVAERRKEPMIAHEDFLADLRRDGFPLRSVLLSEARERESKAESARQAQPNLPAPGREAAKARSAPPCAAAFASGGGRSFDSVTLRSG